jgi:hypothetical protein
MVENGGNMNAQERRYLYALDHVTGGAAYAGLEVKTILVGLANSFAGMVTEYGGSHDDVASLFRSFADVYEPEHCTSLREGPQSAFQPQDAA